MICRPRLRLGGSRSICLLFPPVTPATPPTKRPVSLGVIFLTLYIDLIGFSIIFPLGPDLLRHYLSVEGHTGLLGWLLDRSQDLAQVAGQGHGNAFNEVLFGGIAFSVFSIMQFVFAPFWGALSDRRGRRAVLLPTVAGNALGYLLWAFSGSFGLFMLSRVVCGGFSGNLSVATAAVADVTTRQERSKAMGLIGAAFGLGMVTGPAIGGMTAHFNLLLRHPSLAHYGVNPFTVPALISFGLCLVNLIWISRRFAETRTAEARAAAPEARVRNPIAAILSLHNPSVRHVNQVAFIFSVAFVAMETTLTFLGAERYGYTVAQNTYLLVFLGFCSIVTQGYIVRKLLKTMPETRVLLMGLLLATVGLLCVGFAPPSGPWLLYVGVAFLATGSGLVNPSTTGLISLYTNADEQGRVLGIFRSLGSLSRAITPVLAGLVFWMFSSRTLFVASALLAVCALALSVTLPQPEK